MTHVMIWRTAVLLCLVLATDQAAGQPTPDAVDRSAVSHLLRRLGAGSLEARDAAERDLIAMGPAILPLFAAADRLTAAGSAALTTEATVRRLAIQQRLEELAAARAIEPSTVSVVMAEARPTDVLEAVYAQSGNRIAIDPAIATGPSDLPQTEATSGPASISVAIERANFWEAMDDVLSRAGLGLEFLDRPPGLRIVATAHRGTIDGPRGLEPVVASGPLRLAVARVEPTGRPGAAGVRVVLRAAWEPRLAPVLVRLPMRSVVAEGPAGESLPASQRAAVVEAPGVSRRPWVDLPLALSQASPPVDSLGLLRGSVMLWLTGREHAFEITVPDAGANDAMPFSLRVAQAAVSLQRFVVQDDRLLVTASVAYDESSEALASHRTWLTQRPLILVAPDGHTFAPIDQSVDSRSEQGLTTTAVFRMPDNARGIAARGARIRWKLPVAIHALPVDFAIRDVSLAPLH